VRGIGFIETVSSDRISRRWIGMMSMNLFFLIHSVSFHVIRLGFLWHSHARWTSSCTHSIGKCALCSWSLVSDSVITIALPTYSSILWHIFWLRFLLFTCRRLDHGRFGFPMEERWSCTSGQEHASASVHARALRSWLLPQCYQHR
jgi:hypothetical protein